VEGLGMRFEAQVSEAVSSQEDVASFVRDLEEHYDEPDGTEDEGSSLRFPSREEGRRRDDEEAELPSAELLIQELEKHLNLRRDDDSPKGPERQK